MNKKIFAAWHFYVIILTQTFVMRGTLQMKKQKVCALFCIAAISMSLATPAKADDRYPSLNETEETLYEKENQEEYELPDDIVVDSNNQSQEQQTTEEGTCYVNGKAYLFDQNGAMIKAL